jgi:callose synthase
LECLFVNINRIIGIIIKEIEGNIGKNTFLANFRMSALPVLCKKFVELVSTLVMQFYYLIQCSSIWQLQYFKFLRQIINHVLIVILPSHGHLQKERDASKFDNVVLLLQDMLEVITRDMMVNEIRFFVDSLTIICTYSCV